GCSACYPCCSRGATGPAPSWPVRCPAASPGRPARPDRGPHGARICGHPLTMDSRSVGVEEEFLLVEPETGHPKAVAGTVLQAAGPAAGTDLEGELQQQQLETNSRPCQSLDELHRELRPFPASAAVAAGRAGGQVAGLGT